MPIYEYECEKCRNIHEIMQKMSDKPLTRCPSCSGKLHKLVSQSAFHLKGSGWYATDYSNKSKSTSSPAKHGDTQKVQKESDTTPCKSCESKNAD